MRQPALRYANHPLDPSVGYVTRRFGVRLIIVLLFAAIPIPHGWGFSTMFIVLTGTNALTCSLMALTRRERPDTRALTHWDEAFAMLFLCFMGIIMA